MRVAFVKKKFSIHGGAERYMATLIEEFKKSGHNVHIFSHHWEESDGITFHKVPLVPFNSFLSATTFNANLCKALRREGPFDCTVSFERTTCQDIYRAGEGCHAEWLEIRSRIEPLYKRLSFKINPLHRSLLNIERQIFSSTKLIIANSTMVKDQIVKHYRVPAEKITIIYNGVDLTRFCPEKKSFWRKEVRARLGLPVDTNILLFVGSGFKRKGLKTLVDALSFMKRKDVRLLVIGKGNSKQYRAAAEHEGTVDKIIFLNPQKEIEAFYAAADAFVLPTLYDPFSNATLEAMASGIPVITTKNNGVAEIIENGKEGFVTDELFDAKELAEKMHYTLGTAPLMGERAREKAEKFSIQRAVDEFLHVIMQVSPCPESHT